jgi:hypothetical protein
MQRETKEENFVESLTLFNREVTGAGMLVIVGG